MALPYVVTDDLSIVCRQFAEKGLRAPDAEAIRRTSAGAVRALKKVFEQVDVVAADRIEGFLKEKSEEASLPVISLTSTFNSKAVAGRLSFSRSYALTRETEGATLRNAGLHSRHDTDVPLQDQYKSVIAALGGAREVALADDVLATGGTALKIADLLKEEGIAVRRVIAVVVLDEARRKLSDRGMELVCDSPYSQIIDEVCLRDFVAGMPDGGRNVLMPGGTRACAPYISPFGDAEGWASIPAGCKAAFSRGMLEVSARFWQDMEQINGRALDTGALVKPLAYWPGAETVAQGLRDMKQRKEYNGCFANIL
jgi:hypothetical protein